MRVRPVKPEDAEAIAAIHVHAWQVAYRGIVPSAVLVSLSVEQRTEVWQQNIARAASHTSVAEEGSQILGWVSAGRSRDSDALPTTGEVWGIYVAPAHWRQGVGQRLWSEAEAHLRASGFSELTLWVLKENARAIAFYNSNGLTVDTDSEKTIIQGGAELLEIRLRKQLGG